MPLPRAECRWCGRILTIQGDRFPGHRTTDPDPGPGVKGRFRDCAGSRQKVRMIDWKPEINQ